MQEDLKNKILILDEASLASTNQINALLKISKELNVRLIQAGDKRQLGAVEAGKPFTQEQKAGMQTAVMDDIKRQTNPILKDIVYDTIAGVDSKNSPYIRQAIDKIGSSYIEVEKKKLANQAASMWLGLNKKDRAETLIVTPSHDIRSATNKMIVEHLQKEGLLEGRKESIETLAAKNLTEMEKTRADKYEKGDYVLFYKSYKSLGIKRGEHYIVEKTNGYNKVCLQEAKNGRNTCWLDPKKQAGNRKGALEVFTPDKNQLDLQKNALIRWTKNSSEHPEIKNSEIAKILDITDKHVKVRLNNGITKLISKDDYVLKHMSFAYCSTIHASQGKTSKYVIGIIESDHKHLTNQRLFYVELSRAKEKVFLISDDKTKLIEHLGKITGAKLSSLEHQGSLPLDKAGDTLSHLKSNTTLDPRWKRTMQDVIKSFGNPTYISWFSKLDFDSKKNGMLNLKTCSPLVKDWIKTYYDRKFEEIAKDNFKGIQKIKISVEKEMLNSNNITQNTNSLQKEPENKIELTI